MIRIALVNQSTNAHRIHTTKKNQHIDTQQ